MVGNLGRLEGEELEYLKDCQLDHKCYVSIATPSRAVHMVEISAYAREAAEARTVAQEAVARVQAAAEPIKGSRSEEATVRSVRGEVEKCIHAAL